MKVEFSRRLNAALDHVPDCPPVGRYAGRVPWLAEKMKVSGEAARKWLFGESVPDQTNMLIIIETFKIRPSDLLGGPDDRTMASDHFGLSLMRLWDQLTNDAKGELVAYANVKAAIVPKDDSQKKDEGGNGAAEAS